MTFPTSIATKFDPARKARAVNPSRPSWELLPDEPIDPGRGGGSSGRLRKFLLLGVVLSGGAWSLWGEPSRWREWLPEDAVEQLSTLLSPSAERARTATGTSSRQELAANRIAAEGQVSQGQPQLELQAGAIMPSSKPLPGEKPAVLNKPAEPDARTDAVAPATAIGTAYIAPATAADPLGKRAAAAGLHPDISRALLQRLSETDFKNVTVAIQKAVAETAEDAVLVWPKQRRPELALFQVYFVPGAAPDCRRYVVTVTKDAWSTTALPMERCGVKPVRSKNG